MSNKKKEEVKKMDRVAKQNATAKRSNEKKEELKTNNKLSKQKPVAKAKNKFAVRNYKATKHSARQGMSRQYSNYSEK